MDTRIKIKFIYFQVILIMIASNLSAQDYVVKDSIVVNGIKQEYSHISFGKHSGTKYFKIILCNEGNRALFENEIIYCRNTYKSDFSEFYLVPKASIKYDEQIHTEEIVFALLKKIDAQRMKSNLSTSLIHSKYSIDKDIFEYYTEKPLKKVEDFKDYKFIDKLSKVCDFLRE
ncbi:hypothetical protein [Flavobacterium tegetincola]|uniref:hypothetical protein n=1 Tax=Flavobacterium tegetincola TaxID=150172 RepID=UPI000420C623|nr:hypothetical protein [Flavobacterium tegetincola]